MVTATRAFLEHLIDYAGMFPPARLPMQEALAHYARYAGGADSWLLGRFVCRADQLEAIRSCPATPPTLAVAALGRGGRDAAELLANLVADVQDIANFRDAAEARTVDVLEVPIPAGLPRDAAERIVALLTTAGLRTYFEVTLSALDSFVPFAEALAQSSTTVPAFGLKVRCGGVTAAAVPAVDALAAFICRCRDLGLPWKATAGLHHPVRHDDAVLQTTVHGFLNVFGAAMLARTQALGVDEVAAILREESPSAFLFTADHFAWQEWSCTADQVRDARRWLLSFGSCSFEEPCDDLRKLGLIA